MRVCVALTGVVNIVADMTFYQTSNYGLRVRVRLQGLRRVGWGVGEVVEVLLWGGP